jgi:heme a synthase
MTARARRQVSTWLFACAGLVAAMVVVGGVTRLTHSGLSIVEWKPLIGAIPPLSERDWIEVFEKYKKTPEGMIVNATMTLAGFKKIFFWEYVHRLLGRAIGVVFVVPLAWFFAKKAIARDLAVRLSGIFGLGGLLGALGWYMVASGLVDEPRVSPYRLAAHLGLAFAILALMLWIAIDLRRDPESDAHSKTQLARPALALSALIFAMVLSGAFVAGTHAGFAFNTWPLMAGQIIPGGLFAIDPWWRNPFENVTLVQLDHRMLAYVVAGVVTAMWWKCRKAELPTRARLAANALLGALCLQVALGITTLLLVVPVPLAAAHQSGAVLLFSVSVWLANELRAVEKK